MFVISKNLLYLPHIHLVMKIKRELILVVMEVWNKKWRLNKRASALLRASVKVWYSHLSTMW